MRGAGFGLLGLLVVAAIIFWISYGPVGGAKNGYVGTVLEKGRDARQQADQISGHDENGVPASESIKLTPVTDGEGHVRRFKVVSVVPGGPFATAYGLQANDEITEADGLSVRDNEGMGDSLVFSGLQENRPLVIVRSGQKMTLTPDSPLTKFHPDLFAKPGSSSAIPTH